MHWHTLTFDNGLYERHATGATGIEYTLYRSLDGKAIILRQKLLGLSSPVYTYHDCMESGRVAAEQSEVSIVTGRRAG